MSRPILAEHSEGEELTLVAQLRHPDTSLIVRATFTSPTSRGPALNVYDSLASNPQTAIYTVAADTAGFFYQDVMLASATLDGYWDQDSVGYTFIHRIAYDATNTAGVAWTGGHTYVLEYEFEPDAASPAITGNVYLVYEVSVIPRLSL